MVDLDIGLDILSRPGHRSGDRDGGQSYLARKRERHRFDMGKIWTWAGHVGTYVDIDQGMYLLCPGVDIG